MSDDGHALAAALKARALELGFSAVGIASLDAPAAAEAGRRLAAWVERGDHGTMGWFERMPKERAHPRALWPAARSLVAVAWSYHRPDEPDGRTAGIARYARGRDYHRAVSSRLRALARFVRTELPGVEARVAVDTGPVLERPWAELAGVGFIGKHTNLISREAGNWVLLGELLLDRNLPPDAPAVRRCGTCRRCLDACPTGAIPEPYRVDARRCISYLTIELAAPIPLALRPLVGGRIFGCDDCLDACPWNRFARAADSAEVRARPGLLETPLERWLALDAAAFARRFEGMAILRAGRGGFLRNVCVALGNRRDPASVPALAGALDDGDPLVRGAAAWALAQIGGPAALRALAARRAVEDDADVVRELAPA
ncbi:MAG: tRNA epoxyqueuosine(34) reductase QueG [Candidatus Eisenbacteria bacterium]